MTLAPINIPDFAATAARATVAAKMANDARVGVGRVAGRMFANHPQSTMRRPALRGIACHYGEVFERDGKLFAFVRGCFAKALKSEKISIRVDHVANTDFGSTASGLRFVDADDFLAFEYELPQSQAGAVAASMVACGGRTDVSVGAREPKLILKNIQGHDVNLVIEAGIEEISICEDGAVKRSHVYVVDLEEAAPLCDEVRNGTLRMTSLTNELVTGSKRALRTAEAISAKREPQRVLYNAATGRPLVSFERDT